MLRTRRPRERRPIQQASSRVSAPPPHPARPSPLRAIRGAALKGRFRPPGDKSISHRAFIFGLLECDDVVRTGKACEALGAAIERLAPGRWRIRGPGLGALPAPLERLDFGN